MTPELESPTSFSDLPEDAIVNILSFLRPVHVSSFACTCTRFAALCNPSSPSADLLLAMCERRWGSKTNLRRWCASPSPLLYETLDKWEQLIGFWRRLDIDRGASTLVVFEWSSSCIICYRVVHSPTTSPYDVSKIPFLWMGFSPTGEPLSYLDLGCRYMTVFDTLHQPGCAVIRMEINLVSSTEVHMEEIQNLGPDMMQSEEVLGFAEGSPPDLVMLEIYQYFANRSGTPVEKLLRTPHKNWLKGRKTAFMDCFGKVIHTRPTPERPLQGLWKGVSGGMSLVFYVVDYTLEGISLWLVIDQFFNSLPVFKTFNTPVLPLSKIKQVIDIKQKLIGSVESHHFNTVRNSVCVSVHPAWLYSQGRIWEYKDGTFGFNFRINDMVALKPAVSDGDLLDCVSQRCQMENKSRRSRYGVTFTGTFC